MLLTSVGLGAIAGALLAASLAKRVQRGRVLLFGSLSFPLLLLLFAFSRSMGFSMMLLFLVGLTFVLQNALANTLLQIITPDALRGRVMSLYGLTHQAMENVGGLHAGFVADWIGAPLAIGLGAAVSLVYGLWVRLNYPRVRELT